ncbi:MAG: flagellar motor switch protein FliM [Planctomycetota bacterium]|nr:MAG: flagellar motor switch protein FliM [Planctomycetota bacterium]
MAEDILSSEELEALLAAVEDENTGRRTRKKVVSEYDFIRPNKLSGDQIRSLQRLHENIAQNLTMVLSTYLRVSLEVNLISLGQLTFDVFRNSLANPTVINILSMDPIQERSLVTMDMKLAFSLIDRMLGGPGKSLDRVRPLTPLEQSLLDNVISRFLEKLKEGWDSLLSFNPVVEAREMDPQFVQVIPSSEMVLVTTFTLQAPGDLESGEICLCIPFISLDSALGKLGYNFQFATAQRRQTEQQRRQIDRVIHDTALPLIAELGTASVSIGDVLSLREGDVVVLDSEHDAPMAVKLRGQLKFTARPGIIGRRYGLVVDEVFSEKGGAKSPTLRRRLGPQRLEAQGSGEAQEPAPPSPPQQKR